MVWDPSFRAAKSPLRGMCHDIPKTSRGKVVRADVAAFCEQLNPAMIDLSHGALIMYPDDQIRELVVGSVVALNGQLDEGSHLGTEPGSHCSAPMLDPSPVPVTLVMFIEEKLEHSYGLTTDLMTASLAEDKGIHSILLISWRALFMTLSIRTHPSLSFCSSVIAIYR